jgi:hypothetical protein
MARINIQFLCDIELNTISSLQKLFRLWAEHLPHLLPEKKGLGDSRTYPFDWHHPENILGEIQLHTVYFERHNPAMEASLYNRPDGNRGHSDWQLCFDQTAADQEKLVSFLADVAVQLRCDYAYAHIINEFDIKQSERSHVVYYAGVGKSIGYYMNVTTHTLGDFLPDLYWCNVFGAPYVRLFGMERLLNTPGVHVTQLADDCIMIRLTENISDCTQRIDDFESLRNKARNHLHNYFL